MNSCESSRAVEIRRMSRIEVDSMNGIKGIQLDYNKASIEALKNAGKKIEELVPDLIAKVTQ